MIADSGIPTWLAIAASGAAVVGAVEAQRGLTG
jgi:hypothetical protein